MAAGKSSRVNRKYKASKKRRDWRKLHIGMDEEGCIVAGEVSISARAKPKSGFDKSKLENSVLEPLRELDLIDD